MTTDPTRAAAIVASLVWQVEQVCGPLSTEPSVVKGDDDRSVLEHNFRAILARFERDHIHPLRNALSRIADLGSCANGRIPAYKLFQQAIDIAVEALRPATPSPVTDETALSAEAKARQLLAATINREVFPGKAEHLLSGKDDLLFDARPALDAIIAALASTPQPAAAETVLQALRAAEQVIDRKKHPAQYRMVAAAMRQSAKA